ncbi:MAG: hypothetical protein HC927_12555 [Deltaproteobacteria bacterium]|nr:hypothetical protein [Deltaproteobacteria bacterium]
MQFEARVPGLHHGDGSWSPGELVHVRSERAGVDHDLLIVRATLSREADRSTTTLELMLPQAYAPEEIPLPRAGGEGGVRVRAAAGGDRVRGDRVPGGAPGARGGGIWCVGRRRGLVANVRKISR